ncbi:reverse transcriptase-like protein [Metasolibacillus meyeri]|uniref:Reverse transcriptase-like protein n=1 Tax=Metasolibacillus meyeri TaxID=1071052 RepID=A0AAW9NJ36_9BACL|nr:reverse transcriptase-like protein [Metasolibacillus meyeri]MEC1177450.1 reverse transcriptase-like protein [Metasolibacillus meyeri]
MNIQIEWLYKTKNGAQAVFTSQQLPAAQALMLVDDIMQTGRAKNIVLTDAYDSTWTLKELKKYVQEIASEPQNVTIYFDGGFQRDTRQAGLGYVVYFEQDGKAYRIRKNAFVDGLLSNNEAEYAALHLSIRELEELNVHHTTVSFKGDSQVVIQQMAGEWPVYEKELAEWADKIDKRLAKLGITPVYEHVARKQNEEADRLATQALNGIEIDGKKELT